MGLGIAENAALSSIKAHKKAFDTVSVNIANANNDEYTAKVTNFSSDIALGQGVGVRVDGISRKVDEILLSEYRNQASSLVRVDTLKNYNEQIQILFGEPGNTGTLNYVIDDFFATLKLTNSTPELKMQAVQKAQILSQKIADISRGLQDLRYKADLEIANTFEQMNSDLNRLFDLQKSISSVSSSRGNTADLLDQRDTIINQLSKNINLKAYFNEFNQPFLSTTRGIAVYSDQPYQFNYVPTQGPQDFINNAVLNHATITPLYNPNARSVAETVITGGKEGNITTQFTNGKILALHEIRDTDIPNIINELDNLASVLRDSINNLHNSASGMPAAHTLQGTTIINDSDYHQWYGEIRMGIIDEQGKPVLRNDGKALNPLVLDLSRLNSGNGAGSPTNQTVIDEINQYFYYDQLLYKTKLGNLEDIRIASTTSNMLANGVFKFQMEVVNNDIYDSKFDVLDVQVYDNTSTLVPGSLITPLANSLLTNPGDRVRGEEMQVDFGAGAGGPYTIQVTVKVTEPDGNISTSVLEFTIDDTPTSTDIMNDRYVATSVIAGSAELVAPTANRTFALAEIVDEDGDVLPNGKLGYLRLKTLRDTYGISIDQLTSKEFGYTYPNGFTVDATQRGFSHYFGLNNLFYDNGSVRNSAYTMAVNESISDNPSLLSIGQLKPSASYISQETIGDTRAHGEIVFSANPGIGSTITLGGRTFTFVAAAGAPDEITIGATLAQTLTNTLTVINAINATTSGTADKATYTDNGLDTLYIDYGAAGTVGNTFTVSYNLLGGASASFNGGTSIISNTQNISGGTNKNINITVNPNTYEVSAASNEIGLQIVDLALQSFTFPAAGILSSLTTTLGSYTATLISHAANNAKDAKDGFKKQEVLTNAFYERLKDGSGVNIDEEMANTVIYQNTYVASATIFATTKKLYDVLLDTMRG
ncbi:MAG: hypothetical protein J0H68_04070 [Sphingobacteriia bacterium]|nr:hypothetical protein [Sphingobacteriia bacterium]